LGVVGYELQLGLVVYLWAARLASGLDLSLGGERGEAPELPHDVGIGGELHLRRVTELLGELGQR